MEDPDLHDYISDIRSANARLGRIAVILLQLFFAVSALTVSSEFPYYSSGNLSIVAFGLLLPLVCFSATLDIMLEKVSIRHFDMRQEFIVRLALAHSFLVFFGICLVTFNIYAFLPNRLRFLLGRSVSFALTSFVLMFISTKNILGMVPQDNNVPYGVVLISQEAV